MSVASVVVVVSVATVMRSNSMVNSTVVGSAMMSQRSSSNVLAVLGKSVAVTIGGVVLLA